MLWLIGLKQIKWYGIMELLHYSLKQNTAIKILILISLNQLDQIFYYEFIQFFVHTIHLAYHMFVNWIFVHNLSFCVIIKPIRWFWIILFADCPLGPPAIFCPYTYKCNKNSTCNFCVFVNMTLSLLSYPCFRGPLSVKRFDRLMEHMLTKTQNSFVPEVHTSLSFDFSIIISFL